MPRQPTFMESRLGNIAACLTLTLSLLNELNDAFGPPFVQSISKTIKALVNLAQNVKRNKDSCAELMDSIHEVLGAIISLHLKSEPIGCLPPSMLDNIGKFIGTLRKIYAFVEAQQERNKIKQLFRNNEMNRLLHECHAGLTQAMEVFGIHTGTGTFNDLNQFNKKIELMHKELLELIESASETATLSERSSVYNSINESKNSLNLFSLLPSQPKIFHGREQELDSILKVLNQPAPRIAILGGGGMGKTNLAKAVLHHPAISSVFDQRFFDSAEAATTSIELAALIGVHVGLNPGKDLTKPIVQYFSQKSSCLLILDNLETVWEPMQSRADLEEFLSLLTELDHLALIITMWGSERPAKVRWSHPFLLPLQPLSHEAARKTFMEITDSANTTEEIDQLLRLTDNMPLAVDLIAHLANYEGLFNVLSRWETEKTALFSVGLDRQSNLDVSISLSLSSPRITSNSKHLLSLLSILPNGLSDAELIQSNLGIPDILRCKASLQATSLIFRDTNKRSLLLMPVRECIQRLLPLRESLIHAICDYFLALLKPKEEGEEQQSTQSYAADRVNDPGLETNFLIEVLQHTDDRRLVSKEQIDHVLTYIAESDDPVVQTPQFMQKALESSALCGDSNRQCNVLIAIGWLKFRAGDLSAALVHARAAQHSTDMYDKARANRLGAVCSRCLGKYQDSAVQLSNARELLRTCGRSTAFLAQIITLEQGTIHSSKSEYAQARNIFTRLFAATSFDDKPLLYAHALLDIARIDIAIGAPTKDVLHNLGTAHAIFSSSANFHSLAITDCEIVKATVELRKENFGAAKVRFQQCLNSVWGTNREIQCSCLEHLANIKAWPVTENQYTWPTIYLSSACNSKQKLDLHQALLYLGDVFLTENDEDTAASMYQVALEGFTSMDVHRSRAQCMLRLGELANNHGRASEAVALWKSARPLFERSSQAKDVAEIDAKIVAAQNAHQEALAQLENLSAPVELVNSETSETATVNSVDEHAEDHVVPILA
ncbi:hypothetical protein K438DRAFT_1783581 [Mycena galopus ATCC 62051]|nr:hypothetical protein K438DRAFT_1783581 [Mycena galopus ATCC 62051]